jgi:ComF family protein
MLSGLQDPLLSLIYPQNCHNCELQVESHADGVACAECWASTRFFDGSEMLCAKCGAFFGDKAAPVPVYCHRCDDHNYDKAFALGIYERGLASAIVHLKKVPSPPKRLKDLIKQNDVLGALDFDLIIPSPLSKHRRLERGFNQAETIADLVSRNCRVPVDKLSLVRKTHTPMHRMGMDQKARELTVKNAFAVTRPKLIEGKNILLVDDVLTSGATASACAKVLKKSSAAKVNVFTLARAVMN